MERTIVMGGGALGLLLAARLAAAGVPVQVWTRTEEQARAIARFGIGLEEEGRRRVVPVEACAFGDARAGEPGLVLMALKQTALTEELLKALGRKLAVGSVVALFQNGVGHAERFADALPGRRILAAVTTEGALRNGPKFPARIRNRPRGRRIRWRKC